MLPWMGVGSGWSLASGSGWRSRRICWMMAGSTGGMTTNVQGE
jgi:hypothetical protein